jgi:hypothetical protein
MPLLPPAQILEIQKVAVEAGLGRQRGGQRRGPLPLRVALARAFPQSSDREELTAHLSRRILQCCWKGKRKNADPAG